MELAAIEPPMQHCQGHSPRLLVYHYLLRKPSPSPFPTLVLTPHGQILGILITGMLVPYNNPALLNGSGTTTEQPYIITMQRTGNKVLSHIVNACVTSAFSAGNSFLFAASRVLFGLGLRGHAAIFTYILLTETVANKLYIYMYVAIADDIIYYGAGAAEAVKFTC
ncbi:hypothetical protein BC835DRAFT_1415913 [Cytidiella melzeri]|nr:hypothetical protein BC835DRAFT_1415913 [Cytidiella melzeri]